MALFLKKIKNLRPIIGLTSIFVLAVAIGIWVGATLPKSKKDTPPEHPVLASNIQKLTDILAHVEREYVDDVDLKTLSDTTISELLKQLDPHSTYITARELAVKDVDLKSELEEIGIEFLMLNGMAYVIAPISGGPSEQVGIKAGDKIVKIDDEPLAPQALRAVEVVEKLRGPRGTKVKLSVKRNKHEDLVDFTITRDTIPVYSVDVSYMVDPQIGYIKVSRFTANTFNEFKSAFYSLQKQGMTKLLLDLRGNPGGYTDMAIKMANSILDSGQLIVSTKGRRSKYHTKHYAKGEDNFEHCPVIVLINEGTASAAEILAGALQDNDRALIVGRRSFGKGLVQIPVQLHDSSQLRLTVARYHTPSGRSIQRPYGAGVADYHLEFMNRYKQGECFQVDSIQLDDALKYQTSKERTVYGGGGIMPDYFLPIDVQKNFTYFNQLQAKEILKQYALEYVDQHRESLTAMEWEKYQEHFEINELMLKKLIAKAEEAAIPYEEKEFRAAREHIKHLIKAYIAKNLWKEQGFYPIYHQVDEEFQKAIQLFDEAEALLQQPVG